MARGGGRGGCRKNQETMHTFLAGEKEDLVGNLVRFCEEHRLDFKSEMDACEQWHEEKGRVPRSRYRAALNWLKRASPGRIVRKRTEPNTDFWESQVRDFGFCDTRYRDGYYSGIE